MNDLVAEILALKKQRNAVILAHNYEVGEIQDIADFVGDSLGLSQQAASTNADVIVFCGVHFMAETAAIVNPDKRVLIPDLEAGCSLASTIDASQLRTWKAEHPGAVVVSYVNTTAEVKAESDYCCTSANAVQVVRSIPEDQPVLFLPDFFLGNYVKKTTGRKNIHVWLGECHVHAAVRPADIIKARQSHPNAEFLVHPECGCTTPAMYYSAEEESCMTGAHVLSTGGMMKHAQESAAAEFVVATETGILHGLRKHNPQKKFHAVAESAVCRFMKMITLEKLHRALADDIYEVTVPEAIAARARVPIQRMLAVA